jgi:hypothetical protein
LKVSSRFSLLLSKVLAIAIREQSQNRTETASNALVLILAAAAVLATLSLVLRHLDRERSGDLPRVKIRLGEEFVDKDPACTNFVFGVVAERCR